MVRRIGFDDSNILFVVHPTGWMIENGVEIKHNKPVVVLRILAQGLTFNWDIGITEVSDSQIKQAYDQACDIWNSVPDGPERDFAFKTSDIFRQGVGLLKALIDKGFTIPRVD
jgi:hypothetical protein